MLISRANPVEKYTFDKRSNKLIRHIYMTDKKGKTYEVLKQFSGTKGYFLRYIDYKNCAGWVFYPPGTKLGLYYAYQVMEETKTFWFHQGSCSIGGEITQTYQDIINLFKDTKYKDFVYTLKSLEQQNKDLRLLNLIEIFENYTKDNKTELLVKANCLQLATSKKFLSLTKAKQKQVINLLKKEENKNIGISNALKMIKYNCSLELVDYNGDQKLYNLLKEQKKCIYYYKDYIKLAKRCNHNVEDDYWKYPKNVREKHLQLNQEWANICRARRELEEMERQEKEKTRMATLSSKIKSVSKKLSVLNQELNGYSICVATDLEDIKTQAETLSQCLISCNYYEKHANKTELQSETSDLTLFIKNIYAFEYLIIYCNAL